MAEKQKIKNKEKNYYKISTIILSILILIIGGYFLINNYSENKINEGIQKGEIITINNIISKINNEGSVSFIRGNSSLTLVPSEYVKISQENLITEIIKEVNNKGSVTLFNNKINQTITLIPKNK